MVRYYLLNLDIFNLGKDMLDMSYLILNPRDHEYPQECVQYSPQ